MRSQGEKNNLRKATEERKRGKRNDAKKLIRANPQMSNSFGKVRKL